MFNIVLLEVSYSVSFLPLLILILAYYFFWYRPRQQKKDQKRIIAKKTMSEVFDNWNVSENIPTRCPHCKNPNTKMLRECEWCGNKVC